MMEASFPPTGDPPESAGGAAPRGRTPRRILVIEDDEALARVVCDNLELHGYVVRHAATGRDAVQYASSFTPDLALVDVVLPDMTGFDLCNLLTRRRGVAVIMLTVRTHKADRLLGLRLGADDYVTKPFDIDELIARVQAVLRRTRGGSGRLTLGTLTIDLQLQRTVDGDVHFTRRECDLLKYLAERPDVVVSRDELLRHVWGFHEDAITRAVDFAVARLRKKIEPDPHRPVFLHAVHGEGYSLTPSGAPEAGASSGSEDEPGA